MMRRIGTTAALAVLAVLAVTPAATAAAPPPDDTGRSWEVVASLRFPTADGEQIGVGALAFLSVDDGSLRQTTWPDDLPTGLMFTPDARALYSTGDNVTDDGEVSEWFSAFSARDAATGEVDWSITRISSFIEVALSPDASIAATGSSLVNLETRAVDRFDACVGQAPFFYATAFSPDGGTIWYLCRGLRPSPDTELRGYDVATLAPTATFVLTNHRLDRIVLTPDGSVAVSTGDRVADDGSVVPVVTRIDLATGALTDLAFEHDLGLDAAVSPDGARAYISERSDDDFEGVLHAIDLATMTTAVSAPLADNGVLGAVLAVTPDGARVYAASHLDETLDEPDQIRLSAHDADTLAVLSETFRESDVAFDLTVTPDQAPVARLTASEPNSPVTFDASASTVEFGSIAEYAWDFGDGVSTVTTTPTVEHEYADPGEFTATVRLTSSGGTSTEDVYTGQQMLRNGDASAVATVTVAVPEPAVPGSGVAGELPPAGFNGATWVMAGIGMLVAGAIAVVIVRRRVQPQRKDA
ncbi:PKD domain-containing protein [Agromyces intestinalis]|uniref:PKD domain-containing protein n=1 Tax=Agromyces intestinalis TaxID=2592652 RepID=A0A5C1YFD0_9MICO|nr:PKD domain-containing protein [Agromyces intestinalis]QEO14743.1 PKD domain-containing protein [Agromyces intestinalis]